MIKKAKQNNTTVIKLVFSKYNFKRESIGFATLLSVYV